MIFLLVNSILWIIIALSLNTISSFSQVSEYFLKVSFSMALPTNLYPSLLSGTVISNGSEASSGLYCEYKYQPL